MLQYTIDWSVIPVMLNLSTPAQKWRLVSFLSTICALITMAIPGSLVTWSGENGASNVSYIWNFESWFNPASFALVTVAVFIAAIGLKNQENRLADNLIANGMALLFLRLSDVSMDIWQCREAGLSVWFPYIPPVLIVLSAATAAVAALVSWYDSPAKKPEKKPLFSPSQIWRLAAAALGIAAVIVMAIPGTRLMHFYGTDPDQYLFISYLTPDSYSAFLPNLGYAFAIFAAASLMISFVKRRNRVITVLLCDVSALFLILYIDLRTVLQAIDHGCFFWLPFVPPILLAVSMAAAVVAWFVGLREEKKQ